jgi:hypothetical protein
MTIDPKKIREIAGVSATLSKSAPTAEEHDIFANLASKWLSIAHDRETRLTIDLDRFADCGAPSISSAAEGASLQKARGSARRRRLKRNRAAQLPEPTLGKLCDAAVGDESNLHRSVELHTPVELDLVQIHAGDVEEIWPLVEKFIEDGCSYGDVSAEQCKEQCKDGESHLWLAWSDHCEAAAVMRFIPSPDGLVCLYESMGGENLKRAYAVNKGLEQWAKSYGCVAVRIYGRPGWSRAMQPDFTLKWVVMDKGL